MQLLNELRPRLLLETSWVGAWRVDQHGMKADERLTTTTTSVLYRSISVDERASDVRHAADDDLCAVKVGTREATHRTRPGAGSTDRTTA